MSKYIDADALIDIERQLLELHGLTAAGKTAHLFALSILTTAKPADVAPVKHGKWVKREGRDTIKCSSCGFQMFPLDAYQKGEWPNMCVTFCDEQKYIPRFCPDCGADMENDER